MYIIESNKKLKFNNLSTLETRFVFVCLWMRNKLNYFKLNKIAFFFKLKISTLIWNLRFFLVIKKCDNFF